MASRKERFEQVSTLRKQGFTGEQIAEKLGISRSYVWSILYDPEGIKEKAKKDRYRRPCPECGRLMSGSDGLKGKKVPKRCAECAKEKSSREKRWTREAIIGAIQLFAERNGRPPLAPEWTFPKAIRGDDYPPLSACYSHNGRTKAKQGRKPFASWGEAIEAAGFPRPKQGSKVYPRGQGVSRMQREWVVFVREEDDDKWTSYETKAATSAQAINNVAFKQGEYFAIAKTSFNVRPVEPKVIYEVMPSTPGSGD